MIYHPRVFTRDQAEEMGRYARLERWKNGVGEGIGWKRLSPKQPAQGQILITYGNASHAIGCEPYADATQAAADFDVFILEYPGYGDRPGAPSQNSLFEAAAEGLSVLGTNCPVYLVGESLGSGVACYLAGTFSNRVAGVVLLSPFNRLTDVARQHMPIFPVRLLLLDRFPSEDYLRAYHGPVGVVVDGQDQVVPEGFGLRLYRGYNGPKRLWEFPQCGHIAIGGERVQFWGQVARFWRGL
jgi:pimeloyl-ACP methyl ester carboxylesterase